MKEIVERILKAEDDAKRMVEEARDEAKRINEQARRIASQILDKARMDAQREADDLLRRAMVEIENQRKSIIDDAKIKADQTVERYRGRLDTWIAWAVEVISGLQR